MLLSRVHLVFINQLWYKHSFITVKSLRLSNPTVEKYLLCLLLQAFLNAVSKHKFTTQHLAKCTFEYI